MKRLSWLHVVLAFAFVSIVGALIKQFYLHGEVPFQNEDIFMTTPAIQNESEVSVSHHNQNHNDLLLSVPFYVYEELAWTNATIGGIPVQEVIASGKFQKHSNDYWFMMASLQHPMRTRDPREAKLFVIPTLLNLYSFRVYSGPHNRNVTMCWNGRCDRDLLKDAARLLNASEWIHTSPHLHIVTTSHYGYHLKGTLKMPALLRQALYRCHSITFERKQFNAPERLRFSSYLVGNPCPSSSSSSSSKPYDATLIATLKPDDERFQDRQQICEWLLMRRRNTTTTPTTTQHPPDMQTLRVPICGRGLQCPTLAQSKLGFHVRGDTFGSQRLMDTLLSGTVPVFTRREQYAVQPPWIDWHKLSYFIDMESTPEQSQSPSQSQSAANMNMTQEEKFVHQLQSILRNDTAYQERHRAVLQNQKLFDWTTLVPFDTYMYMLQAELYPETRILGTLSNTTTTSSSTHRHHHRWTALKLPPPIIYSTSTKHSRLTRSSHLLGKPRHDSRRSLYTDK
jgi:hypothetical protein